MDVEQGFEMLGYILTRSCYILGVFILNLSPEASTTLSSVVMSFVKVKI